MTLALAAAVAVLFSPNPSHFGELVTAKVEGAGPVGFKPFAVRAQHGSTYVLQCLDPACLPGPGPRTLRVAGARLVVVPRAGAAQVGHPLRSFRRETTPPPTSYRIEPRLLRVLLLAGAAVLLALAVISVWPLARRAVPQPNDRRTPLERALALLRASASRDAADRRRALDLVARAAPADGPARDALDLAWSRPEPGPAQVEQIADEVERAT